MAGGHSAGGSLQLAELIDKYGEKIYSDLHRYAGGLNLVDALQDDSGYSPQLLISLITNLPIESNTIAAMRGGDEYVGWGIDRYLRANLIDAVNKNTYAFLLANSKNKPEKPEPTYRPGKKENDKPKPNSFATMAAAFYNAAANKES